MLGVFLFPFALIYLAVRLMHGFMFRTRRYWRRLKIREFSQPEWRKPMQHFRLFSYVFTGVALLMALAAGTALLTFALPFIAIAAFIGVILAILKALNLGMFKRRN